MSERGTVTATAKLRDGQGLTVTDMEAPAWPAHAVREAIEALYTMGYDDDVVGWPDDIVEMTVVWRKAAIDPADVVESLVDGALKDLRPE